jgi:hypothetical protein
MVLEESGSALAAQKIDHGWKHFQCPLCGAKYESPIRIFAYSHKCGAKGNAMVTFRRVTR